MPIPQTLYYRKRKRNQDDHAFKCGSCNRMLAARTHDDLKSEGDVFGDWLSNQCLHIHCHCEACTSTNGIEDYACNVCGVFTGAMRSRKCRRCVLTTCFKCNNVVTSPFLICSTTKKRVCTNCVRLPMMTLMRKGLPLELARNCTEFTVEFK